MTAVRALHTGETFLAVRQALELCLRLSPGIKVVRAVGMVAEYEGGCGRLATASISVHAHGGNERY